MKPLQITFLLLFFIAFSCTEPKQIGDDTGIAAIENGLLTGIQIKGQAQKTYTIAERMAHYNVPGISIAVIKDGKLSWAKGYGIANSQIDSKVNINTLFQAGSISKPIAALGALKLVQDGKADLDADISAYLKDWEIPATEFTSTEKVTLRRLLTHTAGMTVHGFPGYHGSMRLPSIQNVLNGRGNTPAVIVDTIPGSLWRYSGGGYTVMEKVVEDITDLPLDTYLEENILDPLDMSQSTYTQPLPDDFRIDASAAYDSDGTLVDGLWHNYPEQAAAGLWTTPSDLAKYCIEIQQILSGKKGGILSQEMVAAMLTKDKNDWGLGPSLKWAGDSLVFQHGGKNEGFTNNMMAFAHKGEGIIVMTNADNGGRLIGEIMNAASDYYGWGLANVREISLLDLSEEELKKFTGKYRFSEQRAGEYFLEVKLNNGKLFLVDVEAKKSFSLQPTDEMKFLDIEKGDELVFSTLEGGEFSFTWNNQYRFIKVE